MVPTSTQEIQKLAGAKAAKVVPFAQCARGERKKEMTNIILLATWFTTNTLYLEYDTERNKTNSSVWTYYRNVGNVYRVDVIGYKNGTNPCPVSTNWTFVTPVKQ